MTWIWWTILKNILISSEVLKKNQKKNLRINNKCLGQTTKLFPLKNFILFIRLYFVLPYNIRTVVSKYVNSISEIKKMLIIEDVISSY